MTAAAAPSVPSRLSFWALPLLLSLGIFLVGSFLWQNGLSGIELCGQRSLRRMPSLLKEDPSAGRRQKLLCTDLPTEQTATPSESTAPIAVAPPSTNLAPSTPEGTSDTAQTAASVPTQTEPATGATASPQPAPMVDSTGHRLNIQASSPSWVRIVVDDQSPKEMILKAGEVREWSAQQGFTLSFGNAGGVTLNLNGQTLPRLENPVRWCGTFGCPRTQRSPLRQRHCSKFAGRGRSVMTAS